MVTDRYPIMSLIVCVLGGCLGQIEVIEICGWHEFFLICIFFMMASQMFNSATNWLFTIPWLLTVPKVV